MDTQTLTLKTYGRGLFYAVTVCLGAVVAFLELDAGHPGNFWRINFAVFAIFLIELYTNWEIRKQGRVQVKWRNLDDYSSWGHLVNHLLIPAGLYAGIAIFTFFNPSNSLRIAMLIVTALLFTVLFTHIRAYYTDQTQLLKDTRYVYDLAKLLLFFTVTDGLLNFFQVELGGTALAVPIIAAVMFLLLWLLLLRENTPSNTLTMLAGGVAACSGTLLLILAAATSLTILQLSFIALILYYISTAGFLHLLAGDLNKQILAEYILILLMVVTILLALTS